MYAIIADSGRQYKVSEGQILDVDYRDVPVGEKIQFGRVLAVSNEGSVQIGQPVVDGVSVDAEVVGVTAGPKLVVQKFRRRKNARRRTGHRQLYTRVRIDKIVS
jgi:large subunit ribosomal protein L21